MTRLFSVLGCGLIIALLTTAVAHSKPSSNRAPKRDVIAGACDRLASSLGKDGNPGTPAKPYRSVQHLVSRLQPGQVGCLQGTFREQVSIARSGHGRARITLTSVPRERATLLGRLDVRGSHWEISRLNLDGTTAPACPQGSSCTHLPSPTVIGSDLVFRDNNVTHRKGICFNLTTWGGVSASRVTIDHNRIHHCGRTNPVSNHDHGIYLANTMGNVITRNLIYENADRGIQLYPRAHLNYVARNVISDNGQGVLFGGDSLEASSGNRVENNVITFSKLRYSVEHYYDVGNPIGVANLVHNNCLHGSVSGNTTNPSLGYLVSGTTSADPGYRNRRNRDYRLGSSSPCLTVLGEDLAGTFTF